MAIQDPNRYSRLPVMAVSDLPVASFDPVQAYAMSKRDIASVRRWHRAAALRAKEIGFDIVYVYAGHDLALPMHFLESSLESPFGRVRWFAGKPCSVDSRIVRGYPRSRWGCLWRCISACSRRIDRRARVYAVTPKDARLSRCCPSCRTCGM